MCRCDAYVTAVASMPRDPSGMAFNRVVDAGAPDGLRMHDLPHHGARMTARNRGITLKELMTATGHSSAAAALRYQHAAGDCLRSIAPHLDRRIEKARGGGGGAGKRGLSPGSGAEAV